MPEPRAVKELLQLGERVLSQSTSIFEDHDNEYEARELLAFCLDAASDDLEDAFEPPRRIRERYLSLITRRAGGEPFPFLTGTIEFWGLQLDVKPGPFIPRASSELAVAEATKRLARRTQPVAIDVCAGQGPIALAIAAEIPKAEVWGLDIDEAGIAQGRHNARKLGLKNTKFRVGDLFEPLPKRLRGSVDLIVAHVPYVAPHELEDLPAEVIEHEPLYTLTDDSEDGLTLMRRVVAESVDWLKPGGWLLLEIAEDLTGKVRRICRRVGLKDEGFVVDDDRLSAIVESRK